MAQLLGLWMRLEVQVLSIFWGYHRPLRRQLEYREHRLGVGEAGFGEMRALVILWRDRCGSVDLCVHAKSRCARCVV